jgi:hypothetical protein
MSGERNLNTLLQTMKPQLHVGEFVFCTVQNLSIVNVEDAIMIFKEHEAYTIIVKKEIADTLNLNYTFVAAWITLTVHSSLEAVGLTAAFSSALAKNGISCNVVAAFYHDHIFVDKSDAEKAMAVLDGLSLLH